MKFTAALLGLAGLASGHAIFQRVSVNGADQGQLFGVRAPSSNNPIQNTADAGLACNNGITYKDNNVITVPAGAKVGAWYQHVIGGPQGSNDADNPIAASHKGPITVYLAKVDNAASTGTTGLKWFKVAENGLANGVWAVDTLIANGGWHYFTMPACVAPGDYLMRVEIIALHSASSVGGVQFYPECAQIRVTGSGTSTGSAFASFPGTYQSNDPGILINIYGGSGQPDNGGRPYPIPGPAVLSCSGGGGNTGGGSTTTTTTTRTTLVTSTTTTTARAASSSASSSTGAPLYGQCGGSGWTGPTTCASGTCKASSQYYSQCLP